MNLKVIARHYSSNFRPAKEAELDWFESQPSLEAAITFAAEACNESGKRYAHQRRIKNSSIFYAKVEMLENSDRLKDCASFHALWSLIGEILNPIGGIGKLYVYETATRIGAYLKLYPEKVYLHAGTRTGAKRLKIKHVHEEWIEPNELPEALQNLPPNETEDILCIYKDEF